MVSAMQKELMGYEEQCENVIRVVQCLQNLHVNVCFKNFLKQVPFHLWEWADEGYSRNKWRTE